MQKEMRHEFVPSRLFLPFSKNVENPTEASVALGSCSPAGLFSSWAVNTGLKHAVYWRPRKGLLYEKKMITSNNFYFQLSISAFVSIQDKDHVNVSPSPAGSMAARRRAASAEPQAPRDRDWQILFACARLNYPSEEMPLALIRPACHGSPSPAHATYLISCGSC